MIASTDAMIRHIHRRWHEAVVNRDLDGLMALYKDDARFESPLVFATLKDQATGLLTGKAAIRAFFATGFSNAASGLGRWYRTTTYFTNGRQLIWEYPRETPQGDQVDLVEVVDVADGLIAHQRVYRGWVGFRTLVGA
jgi:hypothetical protein